MEHFNISLSCSQLTYITEHVTFQKHDQESMNIKLLNLTFRMNHINLSYAMSRTFILRLKMAVMKYHLTYLPSIQNVIHVSTMNKQSNVHNLDAADRGNVDYSEDTY